MMIVELALSILFPIILGFFLKIIKVFKEPESGVIIKFVVRVCLLFLIFKNLYSADFSVFNQLFPLILSFIILTFCYFFFTTFLVRKFKLDSSQKNAVAVSTMFGNYGYLGWGIVFYFLGSEGLTRGIFFTVFFWPAFFFYSFLYLYVTERKKLTGKIFLIKLLKNAGPPITSAVLGIVANYFKVELNLLFRDFMYGFANMTIPLILFTIGLNLNFRIDLHRFKLIAFTSFARLFLGMAFGVLTVLIVKTFFELDIYSIKVILIESIMPTATMTLFFKEFSEVDTALVSTNITFSILISILTIPVWYSIIEYFV